MKKKMLIALLAATIAAGIAWIVYQSITPAENSTMPHRAAGRMMALEVGRVLGDQGTVALITGDLRKNKLARLEAEEFKKTLEKETKVTLQETAVLTTYEIARGGGQAGFDPAVFSRLREHNPRLGAVVSLVGLPQFQEADLAKLSPQGPKLLAVLPFQITGQAVVIEPGFADGNDFRVRRPSDKLVHGWFGDIRIIRVHANRGVQMLVRLGQRDRNPVERGAVERRHIGDRVVRHAAGPSLSYRPWDAPGGTALFQRTAGWGRPASHAGFPGGVVLVSCRDRLFDNRNLDCPPLAGRHPGTTRGVVHGPPHSRLAEYAIRDGSVVRGGDSHVYRRTLGRPLVSRSGSASLTGRVISVRPGLGPRHDA